MNKKPDLKTQNNCIRKYHSQNLTWDSSGDCVGHKNSVGLVEKSNTLVLEQSVPQPTKSCQSVNQSINSKFLPWP